MDASVQGAGRSPFKVHASCTSHPRTGRSTEGSLCGIGQMHMMKLLNKKTSVIREVHGNRRVFVKIGEPQIASNCLS